MKDLEKFAAIYELEYDVFTAHQNSTLEHFNFPDNSCLYFDLNDESVINEYLYNSYTNIIEDFSHTNINFIFLPEFKISSELEDALYYIAPQFRNYDFESLKKNNYSNFGIYTLEQREIYIKILQSIGYRSKSKTGFIIRQYNTFYVLGFHHYSFFFNSGTVLQALILFFKRKFYIDSDARDTFGSRFQNYDVDFALENLDEETKGKVYAIKNQLEELKKSGQFLFALPIIKDTLSNYTEELDLTSVSKISIDTDNRITLPYFNNMEIKMSNLTKAIYILFYKNPKGIDLQQLQLYKNQLQSIYFSISSYDDLDKLAQSIDDVVDINTKAIYTHFSRIKSAFQKVMYYEVAKHYTISSDYHGGTFKYIPILKPQNDDDEDALPF